MNVNPKLKSLLNRLKNKYIIAGMAFIVWITFFDQNSIINRISAVRELKKMQRDKEYYLQKIEEDTQRAEELLSDDENLEKYAREQYIMKKPNEDVFVIVEK